MGWEMGWEMDSLFFEKRFPGVNFPLLIQPLRPSGSFTRSHIHIRASLPKRSAKQLMYRVALLVDTHYKVHRILSKMFEDHKKGKRVVIICPEICF